MATMIVAHVTFQMTFVALIVASRLATIGRTVEEAARDLYAGTWYAMRRVTFPLLAPGIVAGAMLAFTLSLDDFVISFFTSGPVLGDAAAVHLRLAAPRHHARRSTPYPPSCSW